MKKTLLFLALCFVLCVFSYAQTQAIPTVVYTCKGGVINASIKKFAFTAQEWADMDYSLFHPQGIYYQLGIQPSDIVAPPSHSYNCHGYAWHITEGSTDTVCIENASLTYPFPCMLSYNNLDTYWSGNYACFEECDESEAEKIHYECGDHSALKSSVPGKYESKWGGGYVIRHYPEQVPYLNPSDRKYYRSLCISAFSNQNVTKDRTIRGCGTLLVQNVTVSNNAKLTIISGGDVIFENFEVELGAELDLQ